MTRIIIADDHELIRQGIKKIIRPIREMQIIAEAGCIADTIALVEEHQPDLLILDINIPEHCGIEGLTHIRARFPDLPVLILSMYPEERFAIQALKAGAVGYITKSMAAEELIKAIRKIVAGGPYISTAVAELLAMDLRKSGPQFRAGQLTSREMQIIAMLGTGKQIKQIAAGLSISVSSVNTYRVRIFKKTGLSSNADLIRYAIENDLMLLKMAG